MVVIYYGEVKGKSDLCVGAAVRAALREKDVLLASFSADCGGFEKLFDHAPHITRLSLPEGTGAREYFDHAVRMAMTFRYTVVILDGVFDCVTQEKLSAAEVYEFLSNAPDSVEVICTGREVQEKFLTVADEIVELKKG